ncbi:MAG: polyprenyl synthetase family protein [Verrucomicrobiae bacterium]|nr:polyprenyl synthetase family protein [Verrucomicrobiae bacterium]
MHMLAAASKVGAVAVAITPPADLAGSWKQIVEPVEPFLDAVSHRLTRQVNEFDPNIVQYAEYALNGNGKHLRPTLVALAANSLGGLNDSHVTVATIIEMVHLATLVHDDVMDEAEIRRGQLTLAANWGNEIAVLFGDCLFAQALVLAASFPTPEICRAVAKATNTVCSGEILQTQHRRNFDRSRREYFRVLEMKTAELFALSCELAAVLSNATAAERNALRQFGMMFGTAYQVYDDCVDLFGTEANAGKSLGTDLAKGKLTFPVLLAWERAGAGDRAKLEELVQEWRPGSLPRVCEMLVRYETLGPTLEIIEQYLERARQILLTLPESNGRAGLFGVTDYLWRQTAALSE